MNEARFDLIFKDDVEPGVDLDEARSTLESLFDYDTENQTGFFNGQAIVLGKNMDATTANLFKQVLADEGILTHLIAATDTDAEEYNQSRRLQQRRIFSGRSTRVRSAAILPDRRLVLERRV